MTAPDSSFKAKSGYSRMLRGMARRVWEMRRTVEHSHQLYAVEYYRNERLEAELADLREKWPLNGFDEPINIKQFVANHRAWTERANAEAEALRAGVRQLLETRWDVPGPVTNESPTIGSSVVRPELLDRLAELVKS